jgi:hypothetical protein
MVIDPISLSAIFGSLGGALSSAGSSAMSGLGSLGSSAMGGLGSLGSSIASSPIGGMASKIGSSPFGGAALKGLGSAFGSNVGGQLFGADNSDEEALMRSFQSGVPQIQTNSIGSGVFQAPAVGRRFN